MPVDLIQDESWQSWVLLQERDMFPEEKSDFIFQAKIFIEDRSKFYK